MRYIIVRPEDLERITLYTVEDAGSASSAVEQVPEGVALPNRVTVVCGMENVVILGAGENTPAIVVRGQVDPEPEVIPDDPEPEVIPDDPTEEPPVEETPDEPTEPVGIDPTPAEEGESYPPGDPSDVWTVVQLEAWLDANHAPWRTEITGMGNNGSVLKSDLIAFIGSLG